MVLIVGESYTAANGITEVIQGGQPANKRTGGAATTPSQAPCSFSLPQVSLITHLPLTPAQDLYLALCQNGFKLKEP
jgi:hypothetical protein